MSFAVKYRLKFTKGDSLKFIGHLDIMRLFGRAIRRAALPVKYSKGFNPHQLISFASPLSLGMESVSEYMDAELIKDIPAEEFYSLNRYLPKEIKIISVKEIPENEKNAMAEVCAAAYKVYLADNILKHNLNEEIIRFLSLSEVFAMKKTKNGLKEADIRPDILSMRLKENELFFIISAGSKRNLKPETLMESLYAHLGESLDKHSLRVIRLEIYKERNGHAVPLDNFD